MESLQEGLGTKMDNIQEGLDCLQARQQSVTKMLSGLENESFGKCKHKKLLKQKPHLKQVLTEIKRKVHQRLSAKSGGSYTRCWYVKYLEGYTQGTSALCIAPYTKVSDS